MAEWQPLDSAPKDGTRVILFSMDPAFDGNGHVGEGFYADSTYDSGPEGWRMLQEFRKGISVTAELWQPLPDAPEVSWSYALKY